MFLHKNLGFFSQLPILYFQKVTVIPTIIYKNDPYLNYVVLNINGDSLLYKVSGNNNTFIDESYTNITNNGTNQPTQGSFSPLTPANWSGFFNGSTDALRVPTNNVTGTFTVEAWVYKLAASVSTICHFNNGSNTGMNIWINASNQLVIDDGSIPIAAFTSVTVPLNSWCHIAVVRNGTTITGYINGVIAGSNTTFIPLANNSIHIGRFLQNNGVAINQFNGYISNLRVVKDTAIYTANFTPNSAERLKLLPNTSLLTLQDSIFIDNSRNNYSITTATGAPQNRPFSPIQSSSDYTPSLHGGSLYLDGTNFITIPSSPLVSFANGTNFTIECWINFSTFTVNRFLAVSDGTTNGFILYMDSGTITFGVYSGTVSLTSPTGILKINQWYHIAITRSGTVARLFVNGVQVNINNSDTSNYIQQQLRIGADASTGRTTGYVSNFRIVKGQAVYTSNFTPPNKPVTATSNGGATLTGTGTDVPNLSVAPSLLLDFNNGGIIDQSCKNNVLVFGDTKTQTVSSKFGAGSLYFDGTGDYLSIPNNPDLGFGTENFTIEFWINRVGNNVKQHILDWRTGTTTQIRPTIYINASNTIIYHTNGADRITNSLTLSAWNHVAIVKNSSVTRMFVNGVSALTAYTDTNSYLEPTNKLIIGANGSVSEPLNGYLEDIRVTKGVARYTTNNFTPPPKLQANNSDPFFSNTILLLDGNNIGSNVNNVFRATAGDAANNSITRTGLTQGSFSPFSPNGWSGYFNGVGYLSISNNAVFNFSNSEFTIEFWWNPASNNTNYDIIGKWVNGGNNSTNEWILQYRNSGISGGRGFRFAYNNSILRDFSYTTLSANMWSHVALSKDSSGVYKLFVNGTQIGAGQTDTTAINTTTTNVTIGNATVAPYTGYISNLRVVKGLAIYTNTFLVPTNSITSLSGAGFSTSLLTLQDNIFKDNSPNNFSLAISGGVVKTEIFNPFKQTTAYSPTLHGGSGYFDGSSYLLVTSNLTNFYISTGITTVECYVYKIGTEKDIIISQTQNGLSPYAGWIFYIDNQTLKVETGNNLTVSSNILVPLNQWVHVAFVRENNNITLYINGINAGSGTLSITNFNANLAIGSYTSTVAANNFNGYISNLRMVRGRRIYTSNFTPPTNPVTAVNGTVLLLNFNKGSVIDSTGNNVMTTVGSSTTDVLSTAPLSSSNGSLYFDGTSNTYITGIYNDRYEFPSGTPFTIECWFNIKANSALVSTSRNAAIINTSRSTGFDGYGLYILGDSTNTGTGIKFQQYGASGAAQSITATINLNKNTWYHLALVRNNLNQYNIYINGQSLTITENSITTYTNIFGNTFRIGAANEAAYISLFNGYIDDLRITKGIARYTNNFTPQTYENPTSNILIYPTDPFKNYVVLDLNADAVNNEQNNTFLDRSGNNLPIARTGSVTQGSFSPFNPSGWSVFFNGSSNFSLSSNNAFAFGTGDFTVEFWINPSISSQSNFTKYFCTGISSNNFIIDQQTVTNQIAVSDGLTVFLTSDSYKIIPFSWNHVVVTRLTGTLRIFINGVLTNSVSNTTNFTQAGAYIGGSPTNTQNFNGRISNLRIVKGQALYTNNFTPPNAALTTTSTVVSGVTLSAENVSLLTLQDNRFKDNSNNNFTITPNGTPSVKPFSPFQPTATYSPTVHGGSGYFNGGTSYLSAGISSTLDVNSDYTFETWFYKTGTSANGSSLFLFGNSTTNGTHIYINNSNQLLINNGVVASTTFTTPIISDNVWYHLAAVRSGTVTTVYLNGVSIGTSTYTPNTTDRVSIGGYAFDNLYKFVGYLSNIRITKGVAITPPVGGPTAPVQAVSGTSLLLNFDNAGVVDSTGKNNVTTFDNAKVDYANLKYGTGALKFDGTNDYMQVGTASDWTFLHSPSAKWTIEFWLYSNSSAANTILDTNSSTLAAHGISLQKLSNNTIDIFITNNTLPNFVARATTTAVIPLTTWTHVAITYDHSLESNNLVIYLNGSQSIFATKTAQTPSTTTPANTLTIGAYGNGAGQFFNGSMDELRITNDVRYTSNFTVSSYTQPLSS